MNKDIQDKAKALNQWILDQDVVKEYQRYESLIEEHQDLKQLEDELKVLQKQIVNEKHKGYDCSKLIQEYQEKKESFDNNPLVYNYLVLKEEVNELLQEIMLYINEQLKKDVD